MVKIRVAKSQAYELAGLENVLEMVSEWPRVVVFISSTSSKEVPQRHQCC